MSELIPTRDVVKIVGISLPELNKYKRLGVFPQPDKVYFTKKNRGSYWTMERVNEGKSRIKEYKKNRPSGGYPDEQKHEEYNVSNGFDLFNKISNRLIHEN